MGSVGKNMTLVLLTVGAVGCSTGGDSSTLALDQTLDAAGFLIATDIVANTASSDDFLVSCAYASGVKQLTYSRAEVEQNKICPLENATAKPVATNAPVQGGGDSTNESIGASQYTVSLLTGTNYTYVKAKPNMNVTENLAGYVDGTDYCVIRTSIKATSACSTSSGSEIQVSGLALSSCPLTSGYLWLGHVSVSPETSACQ